MPMWTSHWSVITHPSHPPTRIDRPFSLLRHAATPNSPYCGAALLDDIKRQMLSEQPTDVYVTHPNDDHPDHAAASVFVRTALEQLKAAGPSLGADGPPPLLSRASRRLADSRKGLYENAALLPPGPMAALDTHWTALPLSRA